VDNKKRRDGAQREKWAQPSHTPQFPRRNGVLYPHFFYGTVGSGMAVPQPPGGQGRS